MLKLARRNFAYEKFDEYTYPSADLQISARSVAEAAAGNYEWIVSELHPPVAPAALFKDLRAGDVGGH